MITSRAQAPGGGQESSGDGQGKRSHAMSFDYLG